MGWLTSLPSGYQVRKVGVPERGWRLNYVEGWQYRDRVINTVVEQFDAMTKDTANAAAEAMFSDTETEGVRTKVTASVERQNEADAHRVIKTTVITGVWGEWT